MRKHRSHHRVLVAYDSRLGSTAEVAACIGHVLAEQGASVDVVRIDRVGDVGQYDRVVVGSAIRYDRWLTMEMFVKAGVDVSPDLNIWRPIEADPTAAARAGLAFPRERARDWV